MPQPIIPTNPGGEQAKGRIALWLDPDDLRWLAQHCGEPPTTPQDQEYVSRICFRAHAALHKAGLPWQFSDNASDAEANELT